MILITGATGNFGKAVIDFLLDKGVDSQGIAALVRDMGKAENLRDQGINLRLGSYDDPTSLLQAFQGIDQLLLVSGSEVATRLAQHNNVVKAAVASGVKHIVYTSFSRRDETQRSPLWMVAQSHLQTEKWLQRSGIKHTILKNNLYLDFIPAFAGADVLKTGTIYLPAGKGKVSAGLRREYAEATANLLVSQGHGNKTYDFTNAEAYDFDRVAAYISELSGKEIKYVSPSLDEYAHTMIAAGAPAEFVTITGNFAVAQAQGELDLVSKDLEKLLGRKPTPLKDFLATVYSS